MAFRKNPYFILFLIVATELIGFGLIVPILPQIVNKFESSLMLIGVLMSAYSLAQFIAAPLLGFLSDKYGRKPVLVISKLGTVVSYGLMAMAGGFWLFLISRLLDGFTGGNISVARAYVTDITTKENRPKGMAVIGISFGVGFVLGPAIGGLLYGTKFGHALPAIVAGGLSLLATVFTILYLEEPEKKTETVSQTTKLVTGFRSLLIPSVFMICGSYFLYMLIFSGFETTFSLFNARVFQFNEKTNSLLFLYAGIVSLFVQGFLTRKLFKRQSLFTHIGLTIAGVSLAGIGLSSTLPILLLSLGLFALGISITNTYMPSLISNEIDAEHQGTVMGIYEGLGSLSRVLGPILAYLTILEMPRVGYMAYGTLLLINGLVLYASLNLLKHRKGSVQNA